jgi:thioredoxin 1
LSDPELDRLLKEKMKQMVTESGGSAIGQNGSIVHLTGSNFDRSINGARPVFVDFWAEWCGPCKSMDPVVEKLAKQFAGRITFGKLNVDEEPEIATRFDVFSIPTFMIFRSGKPLDAVIGAVGSPMLEKAIKKSLGDRDN